MGQQHTTRSRGEAAEAATSDPGKRREACEWTKREFLSAQSPRKH